MRLRHLGLPVRDHDRSLAFYARWFGFDPATATPYPDGTVIVRNADGFDLALHPVAAATPASAATTTTQPLPTGPLGLGTVPPPPITTNPPPLPAGPTGLGTTPPPPITTTPPPPPAGLTGPGTTPPPPITTIGHAAAPRHLGTALAPAVEFLHFGFAAVSAEAVRELHGRLLAAGVDVIEFDDEPDLVSLKCLDPDGWRVEVYWEP
ncbi:VOC family protein [Actinoplanes subglobosus]|uniref:VOC family protein n=1 Tax=Actinoplanes subglobosus TaxID=1547892 RepID=A0ABV8IPG6_9ACTN